jgi:hypothetical protein
MKATTYRFAHHRTVDDERCLIWGNGIGELLIPVASPDYIQALNDRIWSDNDLVNEGEDELLNTYFRAQTKQVTLYGRLYGAGTPTETASLTTPGITELTATFNYSAVTWTVGNTDFGAPADASGSQQTLSTTKTFSATGGTWAPVSNLVLATSTNNTTSGKFVAFVALSTPRTLVATDTLDVSIAVKIT